MGAFCKKYGIFLPSAAHPLFLPSALFLLLLCCSAFFFAQAETDPSDLDVLKALLAGLSNRDKLGDWTGTDPCGAEWSHVKCTGNRVTQLQFQNVGLIGTLPASLNRLSNLETIALQGNSFSGDLPTFSGLSKLTTAYLGSQQFTSIPGDFFRGLSSLSILNLEDNPLNASTGWSLPEDLASISSLTSLSLTNTTLRGAIPGFLGNLSSLQELRLAYNQLSGYIPDSFANLAQLSRLELNNQGPPGPLSGSILFVGSMPSLKTLWLQVNSFSGTIPSELGSAVSLTECRLNDNELVGFIPSTFAASSSLQYLSLQNNKLIGSLPIIPSIKNLSNYTYSGNDFCIEKVGSSCGPEVTALLSFLEGVNFPGKLLESWVGNDPCSSWQGITCDFSDKSVTAINLPKSQLSGTISPSLGNLTSLSKLVLSGNNLTGTIPESLTKLKSLVLVDVRDNNLYGPVPTFNSSQVKLDTSGNANIGINMPDSGGSSPRSDSNGALSPANNDKSSFSGGVIAGIIIGACALIIASIIIGILLYRRRRRIHRVGSPNTTYLQPATQGRGGSADVVKITVTPNTANGLHTNINNEGSSENVQVLEVGNLVISIELLRNVTNNFSEENVLGKGGFGVVYKGELDDGTKIAVKRMIASVVSNKGLDEFQAEIAVLTKVRHRHLVALLGYCIEGNERLLVYEYMPNGTLSQHLFEWKRLNLAPLSWDRRLSIALDMARGVEYLHGLAHKSFIHRDLKPSNVLLGDDYRAKVSDFGLVKLAPEGKTSVETRLAGTFGYLAPEYAVTGRVTTKADVFSFGVMLMELLTGRKALDESQPEERMHLVTWFRPLVGGKEPKESLFQVIDPAIQVNSETSQSILVVAELAGHCTAREAHNRPDMSHAVNVLSPLVEQWKPNDVAEEEEGIDLDLTLPQALKKWQAFEGNTGTSYDISGDTNSSIMSMPSCPSVLAQHLTTSDGR
ncbi:hypothetical protein KP509_19G015100 [Ceratopteris richardii]|uniref:Protein kinase domain-containing protein n=1 Tax=Ceratopteris richardii TaxID=49495 RepID=A0A8T2SLP7_CERRI|nr:hypothetical protein KP509_19G015100 [Ceratopteris richardii]KAH7351805.1 hypothetical protein KP509_19G015100 [Ceratopteris richardii]